MLQLMRHVGDGSKETGGHQKHAQLTSCMQCFSSMQVHYVADSETEQVEWFSALEGAVARIVRAVAGLEEEEQTPTVDNQSSSSGRDRDWANQLEKGFASISKSSSSRPDGNAMVNIVGYSGNSGGGDPHSAARRSDSFAAGNSNYGGTISYGQIAGMVPCPSLAGAQLYKSD